MGFWDKFTWPFVLISMYVSYKILCCATYIYEKNCQERIGEDYSEERLNSWAARKGKKTCDSVYRVWTMLHKMLHKMFHKSSQPSTENENTQSSGQKRIPWGREIQPFVLVCVASVILPNALLIAAQKLRLTIPSPLSYENTFLLIVPLAWTVGIAFFQYRIQNELIGAETKAKKAEDKQKMQQQEEHHLGELISALGSLYACDLTAYNFNTPSSSNELSCLSIPNASYAFEIANKSGAPCFFLPYYVFEHGLSSDLTITLDEKPLDPGNYSIVANALNIFIPTTLMTQFKDTTDPFHKKIKDFFTAPLYRKKVSETLKFSITVHAKDPFYKSNDESNQGNRLSSIDYKISFQLVPFGGYSSNGSFQMHMTEYSIELES